MTLTLKDAAKAVLDERWEWRKDWLFDEITNEALDALQAAVDADDAAEWRDLEAQESRHVGELLDTVTAEDMRVRS